MSAVTETPSKGAARVFQGMDINASPVSKPDFSKSAEVASIKKTELDNATPVDKKDEKKDECAVTLRPRPPRKYVGDLTIKSDADEPLLQESGQRFVLFPIKYHEVSNISFSI